MKNVKSLFILLLLIGLTSFLLAQDDVEVRLSSDTSSEVFSVQDSSGANLMEVQGDGNVGIGTSSLREKLCVDGRIWLGQTTTPTTTTNVLFNHGGDLVWDGDTLNTGLTQYWTKNGSTIHTIGTNFLGVGSTTTASTYLDLGVNNSSLVPAIWNTQMGTGDAAMLFQLAGWQNYTIGLDHNDGDNFEISNTTQLTGTSYIDASTMFRIHPSGITDINHQSRVRVYQHTIIYPAVGGSPNDNGGQLIPNASWTKVQFDGMSYDEHGEFDISTNYNFTATEEGYYQVNARIDFLLYNIDTEDWIHYPNYPGYVSIAIFIGDDTMYSQGNKLQGADNNSGWNDMQNNLAPNISDVIYLSPGQTMHIRAFQNLWAGGLPLRLTEQNGVGTQPTQVYVSIHKES